MNNNPPNPSVTEELKPCPFCGGEAKRFTIDEPGDNFGGDVIACIGKCGASSHVEFGRKENLVSLWNSRFDQPPPHTGLTDVERVSLDDVARKVAASFLDPVIAGGTRRMMEQGKLDDHLWVRLCRAAIAAMPQQPVHADEVERLSAQEWLTGMSLGSKLRPSDFGMFEGVEIITVESAIEAMESYAALLVSNRGGEGRQDFSRLTLRHNIETILRQWRDAHPNTLLDKIMSAIPRVSNRSGVEDLKHDLDRYMKIANIECNRAEKLQEALGVSLAALESVMRDEYDAFYTKVREAADIARNALDTEKEK